MRPLHTRADALAWMAGRTTNDDRMDWAVRDGASGLLVGRVGLHRFDEQCRSAEIGYGVHPGHRRRGVARRAVTAASSYAFTALNLARISLIHVTGNPGSCAVAGAAGFALEGVERSALDHGDGVLSGLEAARRWVASRATGWASGGSCPWAAVDSDSGELLGSTGLRHIDPVDLGAVASYWTLAGDPPVLLARSSTVR